jgi:hypothetical protein
MKLDIIEVINVFKCNFKNILVLLVSYDLYVDALLWQFPLTEKLNDKFPLCNLKHKLTPIQPLCLPTYFTVVVLVPANTIANIGQVSRHRFCVLGFYLFLLSGLLSRTTNTQ